MPVNPKEFLIIPDKKFREGTDISLPMADGVRPTVSIAQETNRGNLSLTIVGSPAQAGGTSLVSGGTFQVVDSGSLNSTSFIKQLSDATKFEGEPDRRYTYNHSNPIQQVHSVSNATIQPNGCTAFYVPSSCREFCYTVSGEQGGRIHYAYRDLNSSEYYGGSYDATFEDDTWNNGTITLSDSPFYRGIDTSNQCAQVDVCTMEDGSLRMAVGYNLDLDIYRSTDGITWDLIAERILSRFVGRRAQIRGMRLASSAGFLKIVFAEINQIQTKNGFPVNHRDMLLGIVSSDGGATWKVTDEGEIPCTPMAGQGGDSYGFDLIGVGDKSGNFLLTKTRAVLIFSSQLQRWVLSRTAKIQTFISFGFDQFAALNNLEFGINEGQYAVSTNQNRIRPKPRILLCNGQDWLWLWLDYVGTNIFEFDQFGVPRYQNQGGANALYYIDKTKDVSNTTWQSLAKHDFPSLGGALVAASGSIYPRTSGFGGSNRFGYGRAKMYACYDGVAIFGGLWDRENNNAYQQHMLYQRMSGWSEQPIYQYFQEAEYSLYQLPANKYQPSGQLCVIEWNTGYGAPNGVNGGSNSQWERIRRRSTNIRTWNTSRLKLFYNPSVTYTGTYEYYQNESALAARSRVSRNYYENPQINYGFASSLLQGPFGCTVEWTCKLGTHGANYNGVGVELHSYIEDVFTADNTTRYLQLRVELKPTGVRVVDLYQGSNVLIDLTMLVPHAVGNKYCDFRLVVRPSELRTTYVQQANPRAITSSTTVDVVLLYRVHGQKNWTASAIANPDTTGHGVPNSNMSFPTVVSGDYTQCVKYGMFEPTANEERVSLWKKFGIILGDCNQVAQAELIATQPRNNSLRGRLISAYEVGIGDNLKASWSGIGGMEGDSFVTSLEYDFSFKNARQFPSPRTKFRSASSVTGTTATYDIQASTGHFSHDAIAFFNTNGKKLYVQYSNTSNFASITAGVTIDNKIKTGRVTEAAGQRITVDWDTHDPYPSEYTSSDNQKYYLNVGTRVGTEFSADQVIEIDQLVGTTQILLKDQTTNFTNASAGTTIYVYTNKNYGTYAACVNKKYMRILQEDFANFPEGRAEIGTVVVGLTMNFGVPMSWEYTDTTTQNVTQFTSRGGVSWGYKEGPSVRTLQGTVVGDVTEQQRREFRNRLNNATTFSEHPVVFIQDIGDYDADSILLARYQDGVSLQNQGWHYDTVSGRWSPIGDMSFTLVEVV